MFRTLRYLVLVSCFTYLAGQQKEANVVKEAKVVKETKIEKPAKVTVQITVENVELAVQDREQSIDGSTLQKLASFSKFSRVLDADIHQKFVMRFVVKDKAANAPLKVHQAFALFTHVDSGREIIFIAEADQTKTYSLNMDFQKMAKDFDFQSGKYAVRLLLGDAMAKKPIDWHFADIKLTFPAQVKAEASGVEHITFEKKPEIRHTFRQPDVRPSQIVSDIFTALCLVPLLMLFFIWFRIGVNLSNFRFDLYTIGFHAGLTAIFGLYFVFWLQLNMFQTLKYLAFISCFTFLAGNRMLKAMADRRKSKAE